MMSKRMIFSEKYNRRRQWEEINKPMTRNADKGSVHHLKMSKKIIWNAISKYEHK